VTIQIGLLLTKHLSDVCYKPQVPFTTIWNAERRS